MPELTREQAIAELRTHVADWELIVSKSTPSLGSALHQIGPMTSALALALEQREYEHVADCSLCGGDGWRDVERTEPCPKCHGTGLSAEMQAALAECGLTNGATQ
jgi:hypothetical protein